ncbi:MAG TPA: hypothetical protein VLX85_07375 [Stellaceae bacterium]|nr:hypothetical protein [Stellaceae bacterium]
MTTIADGLKKYANKKDFFSHMNGIAQLFKINNFDQEIDGSTLAKIAAYYEQHTHRRFAGEKLHGGKSIKFSQFVASAAEHGGSATV